MVPPRDALARVNVVACVEYLALCAIWFVVRALRWRHLLSPIAAVPLRKILAVSFIGLTAVLVMPLRAGELVRPYLIRDKGKLTLAAAMGTIAAERIIDGLGVTILLGICLQIARPLSPLPDHIGKLRIPVAAVPFYAYLALAGFICAFALMVLFYLRARWGYILVERTVGLVSRKFALKAADFVARIADGLKFLPSSRHLGPFVLETAIYWGLNGLSVWVLARACGLEQMTLTQAMVVLGVVGVGIIVPAGPGLFGAFQASTYAALAMYFSDDLVLGTGAVFVFLLYVLQVGMQLLACAVGIFLERGTARLALEAESGGRTE